MGQPAGAAAAQNKANRRPPRLAFCRTAIGVAFCHDQAASVQCGKAAKDAIDQPTTPPAAPAPCSTAAIKPKSPAGRTSIEVFRVHSTRTERPSRSVRRARSASGSRAHGRRRPRARARSACFEGLPIPLRVAVAASAYHRDPGFSSGALEAHRHGAAGHLRYVRRRPRSDRRTSRCRSASSPKRYRRHRGAGRARALFASLFERFPSLKSSADIYIDAGRGARRSRRACVQPPSAVRWHRTLRPLEPRRRSTVVYVARFHLAKPG